MSKYGWKKETHYPNVGGSSRPSRRPNIWHMNKVYLINKHIKVYTEHVTGHLVGRADESSPHHLRGIRCRQGTNERLALGRILRGGSNF